MKTEQEIKQLAIDIIEGKVFGTWNLKNPKDVGMVFMCVNFMKADQIKELKSDNVVHFYEYYNKAGPRAVNNMPTFLSIHYLTKNEVDVLQPLIEQLKEKKEVFLASKS